MSALEKKSDDSDSPPFSSTIIIDPQKCEGEKKQTLPSQVASFLLGEVVGTGQVFEEWVALVRKRSGKFKPSGFPHRPAKIELMHRGFLMEQKQSDTKQNSEKLDDIANKSFLLGQAPEISLWERLGNAATLNIESSAITWSCLSSLHHTEHTSNNEHSEDELNKVLEVTINSGGVIFFALFNNPDDSALLPSEIAAVIKITSSRLTTLSERLGYEFARWLGVQTPQVDTELNKELEQWMETLRIDVVKFCKENNFNTGFFDGNDTNIVTDAYELKVRLEHILDRIALISDAMNTERPSKVTDNLFIGGALAAKSLHTLQYLGITHILCLCLNEIGQSDSQHPRFFEYKNFTISDSDEEDISSLFVEACDFIATVISSGGKVLVHCFEGKSRSATVVLAYLMMRSGLTLSESWNMLKKTHRRAQPNDGFSKALLELDLRLHGKVSMDWQHKKPIMKVCPVCGKNAGLNTSSLKLHLQKSHRRISSGSVDSGLTIESLKAFEELKISPVIKNISIQGKPRSLSQNFASYEDSYRQL